MLENVQADKPKPKLAVEAVTRVLSRWLWAFKLQLLNFRKKKL